MAKVALLLTVICLASVLEKCVGFNYYWPAYSGAQDLLNFPHIPSVSEIWQPECEKNKEKKKEGSSESSSSESSSSESSSSESKETKESKESEEEGSKESSSEEGESSSKEEKEKKEEAEGNKEGSGEKKEAHKKKKGKESKSRSQTYTFPARPFQQILYPAPSSYGYMPYRTSYVVQPPVASYPVKANYQYLSLPSSATALNGYTSPVVSRLVSSPMTKVVYTPPAVSKTVVAPSARVYSVPTAWNNPIGYFKK